MFSFLKSLITTETEEQTKEAEKPKTEEQAKPSTEPAPTTAARFFTCQKNSLADDKTKQELEQKCMGDVYKAIEYALKHDDTSKYPKSIYEFESCRRLKATR